MKDREFDASIKKRLIDHETAVPADMWDRISEKQKRPKPGRFLLITLLLLVGVTFSYYIINSGNGKRNEMEVKKSENSEARIAKNTEKSGGGENEFMANPNVITQHSELKGEYVSPEEKSINNAFLNKQNKSKTKTNRPGKQNYQDGKNKKGIANANEQSMSTIGTPGNPEQDNHVIAQKKPGKKDTAAKTESLSNAEIKGLESENDKIAIELYASPDFPVIVLNSGNSNYEQALKSATTGKLSYTFGVRFSYLITNKLWAKIGVQYSRLNESVNFKDSLGNTVRSDNRYKTIGIPLLFCYQVAENDKLRLSVNAGLILNIGTRYSGIIPSINGEAIDIKETEVYDENVGASIYLGMDISKQINHRSDFFAEPRVSYSLENMVNPFYAFSRKICSPGLSFGWRYRLYKDKKPQFYSNK